MTAETQASWESYDKNSDHYFYHYNQLFFSNVHRAFIKFLPKNIGAEVLDLGCGSGRDALALARRGYSVTAVEPSTEMLRLAAKKDKENRVIWINDSLPAVQKLGASKFEFLLLSAVWMHIPPTDRADTIKRIASLLHDNGIFAITLRYGPTDATRKMYSCTPQELLKLTSKNSLSAIYTGRTVKDSFNRNEISWQKFVFKKTEFAN